MLSSDATLLTSSPSSRAPDPARSPIAPFSVGFSTFEVDLETEVVPCRAVT